MFANGNFLVLTYSLQAAQAGSNAPWWLVWLLLILVLLAVAIWWFTGRGKPVSAPVVAAPAEASAAPAEVEVAAAAEPAPAPAVPAPAAESLPASPDDLTRIEGIGPKIAGLLQGAGITTFAGLAATEVSRLEEILIEARLRQLANPATWPEQAGLAAAGQWAELDAMQDRLKGGRRFES